MALAGGVQCAGRSGLPLPSFRIVTSALVASNEPKMNGPRGWGAMRGAGGATPTIDFSSAKVNRTCVALAST